MFSLQAGHTHTHRQRRRRHLVYRQSAHTSQIDHLQMIPHAALYINTHRRSTLPWTLLRSGLQTSSRDVTGWTAAASTSLDHDLDFHTDFALWITWTHGLTPGDVMLTSASSSPSEVAAVPPLQRCRRCPCNVDFFAGFTSLPGSASLRPGSVKNGCSPLDLRPAVQTSSFHHHRCVVTSR